MNFFTHLMRRHHRTKRGFTLPELIVVTAIMAIISSVVIVNYRGFNSDAALLNTAHTLALSIRQIQLYGISVSQTASTTNIYGPSTAQFQNTYGIHFNSNTTGSYIVYREDFYNSPILQFAYDPTDTTEFVSQYAFPIGFSIQKICKVISAVETCYVPSDNASIDIEFVRPNPDAYISTTVSGTTVTKKPTSVDQATSYGARIYLTNGTATVRKVYIDKTGQISVS